jgi:hypothetical protein
MNEVAADDSVVATFGSGAQVCVDLALESRKNEVRK